MARADSRRVQNAGSHTLSLGLTGGLPFAGSIQHDDAKIEDAKPGDAKRTNAYFGSIGNTIGNFPITPETGSSWTIFRFLLALPIIAVLVYFLSITADPFKTNYQLQRSADHLVRHRASAMRQTTWV
jgi:hypothetical protein